MTDRIDAFVLDVVRLEGATVTTDDAGQQATVTVQEADAEDVVDAAGVHEAVRDHGLAVETTRTDFPAGEHIVEVTA